VSQLERRERVQSELKLIEKLCALNPGLIKLHALSPRTAAESDTACRICFFLRQTPAPFRTPVGAMEWRPDHSIEARLDRWFPAVPLEIYTKEPPFHPNISADDGFVCLWADYDPRRTIVDGIVALRNVLTCNAINPASVHLMQAEALEAVARCCPPAFPKLRLPEREMRAGATAARISRFDR
jgi:hypothetical protein